MWREFKIDGFRIQVLAFDAPSEYGIEDGRISKLYAWKDGSEACWFDRGWVVKPCAEFLPIYERLVAQFN